MSKDQGPSATSGGRGWRKLRPIMEDLDAIIKEYNKDAKQVQEMKNLDNFDRDKASLVENIGKVRRMVDDLTDMKRGTDEKDVNMIQLSQSLRAELKNCTAFWESMHKALSAEVIKFEKGKSKLTAEVLENRRTKLGLHAKEIKDLTERSSFVKEVKSGVEYGAVAASRRERKARDAEKAQGRKARKGRKGRKTRGAEDDDAADEPEDDGGDEFDNAVGGPQQVSQAQQEFMERKAQDDADIDAGLDLISKGLEDLKQMAGVMNRELKVQASALDAVDEKMDHVTEKLRTQNERLQYIMDQQGGVTRWCPVLICLIILLALAGYIFQTLV